MTAEISAIQLRNARISIDHKYLIRFHTVALGFVRHSGSVPGFSNTKCDDHRRFCS